MRNDELIKIVVAVFIVIFFTWRFIISPEISPQIIERPIDIKSAVSNLVDNYSNVTAQLDYCKTGSNYTVLNNLNLEVADIKKQNTNSIWNFIWGLVAGLSIAILAIGIYLNIKIRKEKK